MADRLDNIIIVSADVGFAKDARRFASYLRAPVAIAEKRRLAHDDSAEVLEVFGDTRGKTAVIVDDFSISCKTIVGTARRLLEQGATDVYAAITHGVFATDSMDRLDDSPIKKLYVTDSIETQPVKFSEKVQVLSIAPLLGEAIRRIHYGDSISAMFAWERAMPSPLNASRII